MSEQRKKSHSILLRTGGKGGKGGKGEGKPVSVELFPALLWPEEAGDDDLFRVRIDNVWHCVNSDKYSFLTLAAVGELVAHLLTGLAGDAAQQPDPAPYLPYKARVLAHVTGEIMPLAGSVHAPPHMEQDGRWWVWLWLFGHGPTRVPCCDVKLVRVL